MDRSIALVKDGGHKLDSDGLCKKSKYSSDMEMIGSPDEPRFDDRLSRPT